MKTDKNRNVNIKQRAENLFNRIGYGHGNAIKRPPKHEETVDRALRRMISKANSNGDCIISGKNGYYRPLKDSNYDSLEFNEYIKKEQARADSIINKISSMQENYKNVEQEYLENKDKDISAPKSLKSTTKKKFNSKPKKRMKKHSSGPSSNQIDKYLNSRKSR